MHWTPEHIIVAGIIVICAMLLTFGIDGDVKSLLAACVGWVIHSGYASVKSNGGA